MLVRLGESPEYGSLLARLACLRGFQLQEVRLFAGHGSLYCLRRGSLIVGPFVGATIADVALDLFLAAMRYPLLPLEDPSLVSTHRGRQ